MRPSLLPLGARGPTYGVLLSSVITLLASLGAAQVARAQDAAGEHGDADPQDDAGHTEGAPLVDPASPAGASAPPGPAARMAASSLTLLVGAQVAPSAAAPFQIGLDVVLRAVLVEGFMLQPRLGVSCNGTVVGAAWTWVLHAGLGVGWLTPVGAEVALAVSAGYDLLLLGLDSWLVVHRLTAELALPVILGGAVVEPYFQLGTQLIGGGADIALGLGLRAGATW